MFVWFETEELPSKFSDHLNFSLSRTICKHQCTWSSTCTYICTTNCIHVQCM